MLLVDTDVMVDVLRKHEPALEWLATLDVGLGVKLATFNGGHYRAIAALEVLQPYER